MPKKGLYHNIQQKRKRIAAGSGEKMRKVGAKGAPSAQNFKDAAKTANKYNMGGMTMADKMAPPMNNNMRSPMGMMNKGYAHGGGIRKVKY
jgi:signal recognition particle GTPase